MFAGNRPLRSATQAPFAGDYLLAQSAADARREPAKESGSVSGALGPATVLRGFFSNASLYNK
jgi:hypothetical protein